jgi:hypothetical protein
MQRRDSSIALPGYNGTNVWFAPGTAINSTEAFHHASDLEEAAYLANRYMFIAMMVIMLAYVLAQMPYTFLRMKAHGAWQGFRLRKGVSAKHSEHLDDSGINHGQYQSAGSLLLTCRFPSSS